MKLFSPKPFFLLLIIGVFLAANAFAGLDKNSDLTQQPPPKKEEPATAGNQDKEKEKDSKTSKAFFENATYEYLAPQDEEVLFDESSLGTSTARPSGNNTTIDVGAITLIQSTFLGNLKKAFSTVATYALNLLYFFAVLEIVVFGIVWALQRDVGWDKLFFKIIKIGLIFFIIQNYEYLLGTVMESFARLSGVVINNAGTVKYVFNPAKIWQYGYDSGVHLLQLSTAGSNIGLAMIQVSLGMGILLVFGLLGIQMVLQMVGFYAVSLGALILLPFGAFTLGRGMFDKAVQTVFQAGIRLMALIIIVGIAVVIWDGFQLIDMATTTNFNINQPLGLFFTGLLFCNLAFYLPKVLSQAVGSFSHDFLDGVSSAPVVIHGPGAASVSVETGGASDMRVATTIEASGAPAGGYAGGGEISAAAAAAPVSVNVAPAGGSMEAKMARETMAQASYLSKSVSESTVKKIKEAVLRAVKEKK
ncbi:type IV secretion system protein TrbL [Gammaproteobacteria bacterium]